MTDFRVSAFGCPVGEESYRLGDPRADRYLKFMAGRTRPNTLRAVAFDQKAFCTVVGTDLLAVAVPH